MQPDQHDGEGGRRQADQAALHDEPMQRFRCQPYRFIGKGQRRLSLRLS